MSSRTNKAEGNVDRIVRGRFFPDQTDGGVFVDVGAAGPEFLSISALYRSIGWRVIALEPNPVFYGAHRAKGHEVYQYACSDRDEDNIDFVVVNSHGTKYREGQLSYESFSSIAIKDSYSSLKKDLDTTKIKVNLRRLDTILRDHAPDIDHIDILSADVEGWELEVLNGLDLRKYKPRVMIIENLFQDEKYRSYMKDFNYVLWRRISPNDIYVDKEFLTRSARTWRRYFYDFSTYLRR